MIGTVVQGRYRVESELGRGAMGVVYRAHDTVLGRDVALKVLPSDPLDAAARERFTREARLAARLHHPNIVAVHDAGDSDGAAFLVMELVAGRSLRQLGPCDSARVARIGIELARALAHAHALGVVHRDLKPENVLQVDDGDGATIKLTDFGLAHAADTARLTRPGTFVGTFAYLAPEQAQGAVADARADLYSLGVLLYELATGQVPFRGSPPRVISQHLVAAPAPPRSLAPELAPELEAVILALLAKDPAARPASALAVIAALQAIDGGAAVPPASPTTATPAASARGSVLVGRQQDLHAVAQTLLGDDARLVTMTGPGGTGKTRLARQVADELAPRFAGGTWFVPLAALADPELVASHVARALDVQDSARQSAAEAVRERLSGAPALLVLDNFEHLLAAVPFVRDIVDHCPAARVLVTSRERLRIAAEREFALAPLAVPPEDSPDTPEALAGSAAVELFVRRGREARPGFVLDDDSAPAVARICRRLGGVPLAIELAAARLRMFSPAALAVQLEDARAALDLLSTRDDRPERHRTQRATLAWSYRLLSAPERRAFRRLAVLPGAFPLAAAQAVAATGAGTPPMVETLGELVDKHLLRRDDRTPAEARFEMLDTVRQFALEMLRRSGGEPDAMQRLFEWHMAHASALEPELRGAHQSAALDALEADLPGTRAALAFALGNGRHTDALRLLVALRWFWQMRGHATEARRAFAAALAGEIPDALRAQALHVSGILALGQGDLTEAERRFQDAEARFRASGDDRGLAQAVASLGLVATERGDPAAAIPRLEEGLALRRKLADVPGEGDTLINLGQAALGLGDAAAAQRFGEQALAIMRRTGNEHHAATCLALLGHAAVLEGDLERAGPLLRESLAVRRSLQDTLCSGSSHVLLGRFELARGAASAAAAHFRESLTLLQRAGARHELAGACEGLAAAALAGGNPERATRWMGTAEALRDRTGSAQPPIEVRSRDALRAALATQLTPERLSACWAEGRLRNEAELAALE